MNVYTVLPAKGNSDFRPLGSVRIVLEEPTWWFEIQVNHNLLYIGSDAWGGGGVVWDFESGRYTLVPVFNSPPAGSGQQVSLFSLTSEVTSQ